MKTPLLQILSALLFLVSFRGDKKAYQLYDSKGKETSYEKLLNDAKQADIILFGELHNNPLCHWLEQELTKDLYEVKKENLMLSSEMFESDDQVTVSEYLEGKLSDKTFKDEVKLWSNYTNDYKPLLDFAKNNHLQFIAANIPRRYASLVYGKGLEKLDSIEPEAKKFICPLPMKYDGSLKCYKDIYEAAGGHGGENLPKSQAVKDATMAYFILKNLSKGKTILHYNGSYHSNYHQGIEWYLRQEKNDLKILTIGSTEQESIDTLAKTALNMADYIICNPASMSKSY
ncbi:MAG: Iron-regulated protein [Bacteroidetes bacterium]|nr:Iron-regulated protein [Bacteroidota bacterium]